MLLNNILFFQSSFMNIKINIFILCRLIKGDGEVLEEIVSRDRHKEINRQATKGDGEYFQTRLKMNAV